MITPSFYKAMPRGESFKLNHDHDDLHQTDSPPSPPPRPAQSSKPSRFSFSRLRKMASSSNISSNSTGGSGDKSIIRKSSISSTTTPSSSSTSASSSAKASSSQAATFHQATLPANFSPAPQFDFRHQTSAAASQPSFSFHHSRPFTYTWTIEHFSKCEIACSREFALVPHADDVVIELCVSPRGDAQYDSYVFIRARIRSTALECDEAEFRLSVLDARGARTSICADRLHARYEHKRSMSFAQINIYRPYLFDETNQFLSDDDRITIRCDVYYRVTMPEVAERRKLQQDLRALLQCGLAVLPADHSVIGDRLSDVILAVGSGSTGNVREFALHKAILAARSPIFAAMFCCDNFSPESAAIQNGVTRIEINDVSPEVFAELLKYIYGADIKLMDQYALELFSVADKYQLESLKEICEQSLASNLTVESAASTLLLADTHNASRLKSKCVKFITKNSTKVMATEGWNEMARCRLELLLELYRDIAFRSDKPI